MKVPEEEEKKERDYITPAGALATALGLGSFGLGQAYHSGSSPGFHDDVVAFDNLRKTNPVAQGDFSADMLRQNTEDYVSKANALASNTLFGNSTVDVMKFLRTNPLMKRMTGGYDFWNPEVEAHYKAFSDTPASSYLKLVEEAKSEALGSTNSGTLHRLSKYLSPEKFKEIAAIYGDVPAEEFIGTQQFGTDDSNLRKINQKLRSVYADHGIEDVDISDTINEQMTDAVSKFSPDASKFDLKAFDPWLKAQNPQLWKEKQKLHTTNGIISAEGIKNYGGGFTKPLRAIGDYARPIGAAIGAAGIGALVYAYMNKKKKEEENTKEAAYELPKTTDVMDGVVTEPAKPFTPPKTNGLMTQNDSFFNQDQSKMQTGTFQEIPEAPVAPAPVAEYNGITEPQRNYIWDQENAGLQGYNADTDLFSSYPATGKAKGWEVGPGLTGPDITEHSTFTRDQLNSKLDNRWDTSRNRMLAKPRIAALTRQGQDMFTELDYNGLGLKNDNIVYENLLKAVEDNNLENAMTESTRTFDGGKPMPRRDAAFQRHFVQPTFQ